MSVLFFMPPGSYEAFFRSHKVWSLPRKLVFQSGNTLGVSNQSLTRATEAPPLLSRRNLKTEVSLWEHIKCFPCTLRDLIWKRNDHRLSWICVWRKLGKRNHIITVVLTFSNWKAPFSNVFLHTKTQSRRFQILPVWRAFSKSSIFVTD